MGTGKTNFTTQRGVQYLLDKYLSSQEKEELRYLNTPHTQGKFTDKLVEKLEQNSGGGRWVPSNYTDELSENASALIGTTSKSERLKNGRNVTIYETRSGKNVYEDNTGRVRDYKTGRFTSRRVFDE